MTYKILIIGATGFLGGTILSTLLSSKDATNYKFSVLVRKEEHAEIFRQKGIEASLFYGLNDVDIIKKLSSENDVVINCADAANVSSAEASIEGLGLRKNLGKTAYYIHTSGTTILGDKAGGNYEGTKTYSDLEDIYAFEMNQEETYDQSIVDTLVVDNGVAANIKTFIVAPPMIYGQGTGWFKTISYQIPTLTKLALDKGEAKYIGKGLSIKSTVHVCDLSEFYELLLHKILAGEEVPYGRNGYYFVQDGLHSWREIADHIGRELKKLGKLPTSNSSSIDLEEAAQFLGLSNDKCNHVFASNTRSEGIKSRQLGWNPTNSETFADHFAGTVKKAIENLNK